MQAVNHWPGLRLVVRLVLAVLGGYGLTQLLSLVVVASLPLTSAEKVSTAFLLSFLLYALILLWALMAASLCRVSLGFAVLAVGLGLLLQWRGL